MRFAFIEAKKAEHDVRTLCRVLRVSRQGFYAWSSREESQHDRDARRLGLEIRAAFQASKRTYGSPGIRREFRNHGTRVCRHRIARLMREQGIRARPRRRFVRTTDSTHGLPTPKNLLARRFNPTAPNRVWASDVTYLATREGWLFLAVVIDLFSRRVVGWAMSEHNDEQLTLAALQMALDHRRPRRGLMHHSDRGTTYASGSYQDLLARHGIVCSMSRKGNCWDNAVVESFFSTLDIECARGESFTSRTTARQQVTKPMAAAVAVAAGSPVGKPRQSLDRLLALLWFDALAA